VGLLGGGTIGGGRIKVSPLLSILDGSWDSMLTPDSCCGGRRNPAESGWCEELQSLRWYLKLCMLSVFTAWIKDDEVHTSLGCFGCRTSTCPPSFSIIPWGTLSLVFTCLNAYIVKGSYPFFLAWLSILPIIHLFSCSRDRVEQQSTSTDR